MRIKKIDELPEDFQRNSRLNYNNIQRTLMDFYESDMSFAHVDFDSDEYSTSQSLYSGMRKSIQKLQLPIEARLIRGAIYLIRTED